METGKISLSRLYQKARDLFSSRVDNLKSNVSALTNPQTRQELGAGLKYSAQKFAATPIPQQYRSVTNPIQSFAQKLKPAQRIGNKFLEGFGEASTYNVVDIPEIPSQNGLERTSYVAGSTLGYVNPFNPTNKAKIISAPGQALRQLATKVVPKTGVVSKVAPVVAQELGESAAWAAASTAAGVAGLKPGYQATPQNVAEDLLWGIGTRGAGRIIKDVSGTTVTKNLVDQNGAFQEPYKRGDISIIQKRLDEMLGTDSFKNSSKWQAAEAARNTAKKQIEYYASQGDVEAQKYLKEINFLEEQIASAQTARTLPTKGTKPNRRMFEYTEIPETPEMRDALKELEANQINTEYTAAANDLRTLAKESKQPELYTRVMKQISAQGMSQAEAVEYLKQGLSQMRDTGTIARIKGVDIGLRPSAQPTKGVEATPPPAMQSRVIKSAVTTTPPKMQAPVGLQRMAGGVTPPPPPKQRMRRPRSAAEELAQLPSGGQEPKKWGLIDELYTQFVDRFHPMSKLAKQAGKDAELGRSLARYYGSGSTATYHLQQELAPILKQQEIGDLKEASIAMRDIELAGREIKGSPQQKKAMERLQVMNARLGTEKMKQLGETLQQLYKYQDEMVRRYLVDTGIMSEKAYNEMRKNNQFYIPFKRVMDQVDEMLGIPVKRGAGSVGKQNVVYKIKGSDKEIVDPIESIVENTYKLVSLGRRQQVAQQISLLQKEFPEIIRRSKTADQRTTISLFENGKKVHYTVPPEVAEAARGMGEEQLVMLAKILKPTTDMFRTLTTGVNPEFTLPNISRDVQSALFNAGVNPLNWASGLAHMIKKDEVYQAFLKSGGLTSRISTNKDAIKQTATDLVRQKKFRLTPREIIQGIEMLGQYSEQPTRIAAFKEAYERALKSGMSQEDALGEAAYWAQESTVNFARRGSKMTNINAIYAYLNARVQGVDRMMRTIKNEPKTAAMRLGFGFLAPSLSLYAWNARNPAYYDENIVSEREKKDNFIFMLPGEGVDGTRYLKIPKSEVGKIVNPVEEFLDFAQGYDSDTAGSIMNVLTSFLPIDEPGGTIPTAIKPVVEQAVNKNFYFNQDIVPQYKEAYPAGYQDTSYTAPIYRMVGQNTNISPARIQHLSESYLGGAARFGEAASRPFIPDQYKTPENSRGASVNSMPVVRRFAGGAKMSEEEFSEKQQSKSASIQKKISTLQNRAIDGTLPQDKADKEIEKLAKELDSVEKSDFRVGALTPQASFEKKVSLKLPEKITEEEAAAYYMRDIPEASTSSAYNNALREKKIWSRLSDINSSELLNDSQKDMAVNAVLQKVGIDRADYDYYQVAKENNDLKSLYAAEQLTQMMVQQRPKEEIINWLVESRREVNGNQLLTSGVINSLVDQGVISYNDGQMLKDLSVTGTKGNYKTSRTSSKRRKKISVRKVTPPKVQIVSRGKSTSAMRPSKLKAISTRLKV